MVAIEWDAQLDKRRGIVPGIILFFSSSPLTLFLASMPTMILTSTAIDQILPDPTEARTTSLRFLPTGSPSLLLPLLFLTSLNRIFSLSFLLPSLPPCPPPPPSSPLLLLP
jgi:hypothetical protein